LLVSM